MSQSKRISPETLQSIRDRIAIQALLPSKALRPCGDQLRGRCPLPGHEDRNPSFYISPARQRFYCHGCKRGGDVIELHRLLYGTSFREAVDQLLEIAGSMSVAVERQRGVSSLARESGCHALSDEHRAALVDIAQRYRQAAHGSKQFRRYLEGRGFDERHTAGLGFAPVDGIGLLGDGQDRSTLLRDLGLLDQRAGHLFERLRGGIIFTVTDLSGAPQGFVCRRIHGLPKYLNSRFPKTLFPLGLGEAREAMIETRQVVLVEGPFDWLAMRALECWSALAVLGTHVSADLATVLHVLGIKKAMVAFDADAPGQLGMSEASALLHSFGVCTTALALPTDSDPASTSPTTLASAIRSTERSALPPAAAKRASGAERCSTTDVDLDISPIPAVAVQTSP